MYSKVAIKQHPIHPMLVAFPITFYLLTFIAFAIYNFSDAGIFWYKLGFFSNMVAVAAALLAAIPGFIDWAIAIPNKTAAKTDGLIHMCLNLVTLGLFGISAYVINGSWDTPVASLNPPLVLTGLGCVSLLGAGYYGWIMIGVHKVGVSMSPEQEHLQDEYEKEPQHKEPPVMYH
ncbi:MAG TPA: DUF2231 domain-containing protein [Bdellovibrio sp.]|uniref:DUF2231 domain-containing protein n=1 Tax=Bdellovibrio sp. TaxID=28201 RepID=UPI002F0506A5